MSQYIFNINEDEGDFAVGKCELNLPSVLHFINCEKMVNKNQEKNRGRIAVDNRKCKCKFKYLKSEAAMSVNWTTSQN